MKKFILINLLITIAVCDIKAQSEIGIEIGHHLSQYRWQTPNKLQILTYSEAGLMAGLFWEKEVSSILNIRTSFFYTLRYFNTSPQISWYPYKNSHCFSLPIKAILKAGKIVHFGFGIDPMVLLNSNRTEISPFHIGPSAEISFRIRKIMRLSFYCNYDFVMVEINNLPRANNVKLPKANNIILGASFSFVFKKIKKRRVIYSPG